MDPQVSIAKLLGTERPTGPGLYRLRTHGRRGLLYIGQTGLSLARRLEQQRRGGRIAAGLLHHNPSRRLLHVGTVIGALWNDGRAVHFSYVELPEEPDLPMPERRGLEVDLIAAYRATMGRSPDCQFMPGQLGDEFD